MQLIALCKLLKHHAASGVQFSIFRVQSNAWLLSFKCSVHVLVVVMKNLCKTVLNEEIPVNKYHKKINHMSKLVETMFLLCSSAKIVGKTLKYFRFNVN